MIRVSLLMSAALFFCASAVHALEVRQTDLGRKVEAWYAVNDTVPIVQMNFAFEGAGYASDTAARAGLAQLFSNAVLEGGGDEDARAFKEKLEAHAITISSSVSADRMVFSVRCLTPDAPLALKLLTKALTQSRFEIADITRLKAAQISALERAQENPEYVVSRLTAVRAFGGHPYANPPLGTVEGITAISPDDLRRFGETYLSSSNLKIAAAGDIDAGLLEDIASPLVKALPENVAGPVTAAAAPMREQGVVREDTMDVPQTAIALVAPGIRRSDPDFYASYLLMEIAGGGTLTSRLAREVRQEAGLVYGIDLGLQELTGAALISGNLSTRNATRDVAIEKVKATLGEIFLNGVTTQECEDAKTFVIGNFPLQLADTQSVASLLLTLQIYQLGADYIDKRQGYFEAVSCGDINRAAKNLLDPARFLFVAVGGKPSPESAPETDAAP
ncbi:MAG: M16 family metallopeptidase [Alphaproteobacteria bacterium]|jgi:zinc protease